MRQHEQDQGQIFLVLETKSSKQEKLKQCEGK